ncbi:MAG: Rid family hydrolase [Proteobacteria bacterium]|nr:Rid family hydrolase [Pseudomonadota bacterium]
MKLEAVNPWSWQDAYGYSQAIAVSESSKVLYCAGQTSVDAQGNPVCVGDMGGQVAQALNNLEQVLRQAGATLANVVRLHYYTTDVPALFEVFGPLVGRLQQAGCKPAAVLHGVTALYHPDIMVEIEATAVM